MEGFLGMLLVGAIVLIIVLSVKKKNKAQAEKEEQEKIANEELEKQQLAQLKTEWDNKKKEFLTNGLPIVNTDTLHLHADATSKHKFRHYSTDDSRCGLYSPRPPSYAYKDSAVTARYQTGKFQACNRHKFPHLRIHDVFCSLSLQIASDA